MLFVLIKWKSFFRITFEIVKLISFHNHKLENLVVKLILKKNIKMDLFFVYRELLFSLKYSFIIISLFSFGIPFQYLQYICLVFNVVHKVFALLFLFMPSQYVKYFFSHLWLHFYAVPFILAFFSAFFCFCLCS